MIINKIYANIFINVADVNLHIILRIHSKYSLVNKPDERQ